LSLPLTRRRTISWPRSSGNSGRNDRRLHSPPDAHQFPQLSRRANRAG
jgi:hypothetical protein